MNTVYTIGHSNHSIDYFIELLSQHEIGAIADVRSHPYSRFVEHFSQKPLKVALKDAGIAYVFLGHELGARSENPACYVDGKVQYDRLAAEPAFAQGLGRVRQGMERFSVALMCSEKDPLDCHRTVLVARKLYETGTEVTHILADGSTESHEESESRLLEVNKLPAGDMFKSREAFVADAYKAQEDKIAYQEREPEEATNL
jgi:uncharacterized protein (DUF488 family)